MVRLFRPDSSNSPLLRLDSFDLNLQILRKFAGGSGRLLYKQWTAFFWKFGSVLEDLEDYFKGDLGSIWGMNKMLLGGSGGLL